ncbi:Transposase and inactivated derivatives [Neisseria weaveri]|uniref:Transposase and inactivated derivatives n=1 Tax=Neisseria weaveri TaxID=28091 RepID=A0A3S4ZA35_9NEIS|nr:Transposase and inactivated derivatives [Neisseria weaveri]
MLCMETIAKVHRLFHRQKLSQREIAKQLKLSRNTVAPPSTAENKPITPSSVLFLTC